MIKRVSHLIERLLQMWCAHAFCNVSVSRVRQEELPLSSQSSTDVFLSIDVLLTAVHHPDVAWRGIQRRYLNYFLKIKQ